jgi:hypothetical protein
MKVNRSFVLMLLLVLPLALMAFMPQSMPIQGEIPPDVMGVILKIALGFASLVGVSQLVAVLVQVGKLAGLVKDNTAHKWAAGLNLLCFSALVYFGIFEPQVTLSILDGYAAQIAEISLFIIGFIMQITSSKPAYDALKASRVPFLSVSNSA